MANTTTSNLGSNSLGVLFDRRVIQSLQPNLYFEQLGDVRMVEMGNNTDRFAVFTQIATSSVASLTEATNPTSSAVTVTVSSVTPTQYGIAVQLSDLVVQTAFIDLIQATAIEVGYAMARNIDNTIQTTANAGTNIYYGGNRSSRATLGAGDLIDLNLFVKGGQKLVKGAAPVFPEGMYRAVAHPDAVFDLKTNTSSGQWIDIAKYTQPETVLNGEIGMINNIRVVQSPNVQTFSSTVTVYPVLIAGPGGFRVSYFLPGKVNNYIIHPEAADTNNPIGQNGYVGSKVNMGVARIQEARLVRLETAVSVVL